MMEHKYKVVLIGNRLSCLHFFLNNPYYDIVKVYASQNSILESFLEGRNIDFEVFSLNDSTSIISKLFINDYEILVSNGCPFILPASDLKRQGKVLVNTHPTYLPYLRGAKALNGIFYNDYTFVGATTHYISDEIDAGNIIFQDKIELSEDIDQGLVYYLSFKLEEEVFKKAMQLLEENNFDYAGIKMDTSLGSYFNRNIQKQTIDFSKDSIDLCIKKIRSFGIPSQGCFTNIEGEKFRIFSCQKIINPYLCALFQNTPVGTIALRYEDCMLIKLKDGILKIDKYRKQDC